MIFCGSCMHIVFTEDKELYCCGCDHYGLFNLSDRSLRPKNYVKLEHNFGVVKNVCCKNFGIIISNENNELFVCGSNFYGQFGLGHTKNTEKKYVKLEENFGSIKNIYGNDRYFIILNDNNEIFVCGENRDGQLGLGDNNDRSKFEKLEHNFGMIKNIHCGFYHSVILTEDNRLFVCGKNIFGQLGLGLGLGSEIGHWWMKGDYKSRNKYVELKHNLGIVKTICCDGDCNMILNENNELFVCGCNNDNIFGLESGERFIDKYLKLDFDFGIIKKIGCCRTHSMVLNENNELFVCGSNYYGQLGLGDNIDRNRYTKVIFNFGNIIDLVCIDKKSILLNDKNELFVCGDNGFGYLCLDEYEYRSVNKYVKICPPFEIVKKKYVEQKLNLNFDIIEI
jgi:alpha-tubulin suppressor-like RCC1 family protein